MRKVALRMGWVSVLLVAQWSLANGALALDEAPEVYTAQDPVELGESTATVQQPEEPTSSLKQRVSLEASWGTVGMEQMPPGGSDTFLRVTGTGMAFYLTSRYWFFESLSIKNRVGILAPQAMIEANRANALRIGVPVQSSLQFDFGPLMGSYDIRPWLGAGPGIFFGSRDDGVFSTEVGAVVEGGVDFVLSRHFILGASLGYQFVTGLQSAGLFTIGVGYLF